MKRRLALLAGVTMLSTIGMFAPASPASATSGPDVCVGTGNAALTLGLSYPITPASAPNLTPPNLVGFFFSFTAGTCLPVVGKSGLSATGSLHGWCGHSIGQGITANGDSFRYVSVGTFLVIYGHLTGVVSALPNLLVGGSCTDKTAANFLITGVVAKVPVLGVDLCTLPVISTLPTCPLP